jgi:2-polyprenyl-6-methoxyphenol hydroxylase-like FAD-dependent oxidoreductase
MLLYVYSIHIHIGQGAAMAFEDAVILCRKLKEVKDLSVRDDVCYALRNYENDRLARVRRVQEWTADQVRLTMMMMMMFS